MQGDRTAANEPNPWLGVCERITIGGYLLWMAVRAVHLNVHDTAEPRRTPQP